MNNRLKFRVWFAPDWQEPEMIYEAEHTYDNRCRNKGSFHHESFGEILEDKDCIVMQSTGKKDTNGKLIYEDDILELKAKNGMTFQYAVKFKDYCFILEYINGKLKGTKARNFAKQYAQPQRMYEHGYMVIGNIYQNKELLNENS